jgi:hypothetical protein
MLSVCIKTSDNVTIVWVLNGWYRFGLGFYDLWIIIFSNCPDNMVFFVFQFIIQMSLNASILLISKGLNYFYESKNKSWATYYILSKKKEMAVTVSTDTRMRGSQGTASLRSTISAEEVWWCGVPKPNWCTSTATLTPLDRDEVLTPHMLPAMNLRREVFQHDNTRPHTARATVDFLANQNVTVLPWPLNSLDLNPI